MKYFCAKNSARYLYISITPISPHKMLFLCLFPALNKPKLREVKRFVQSHTAVSFRAKVRHRLPDSVPECNCHAGSPLCSDGLNWSDPSILGQDTALLAHPGTAKEGSLRLGSPAYTSTTVLSDNMVRLFIYLLGSPT